MLHIYELKSAKILHQFSLLVEILGAYLMLILLCVDSTDKNLDFYKPKRVFYTSLRRRISQAKVY